MNDEDALLRAIIDTPDDVPLRLVYADYLEEEGRTQQALMVRTQCALGELLDPQAGDLPYRTPGFIDVSTLRPELRDAFVAPFADLAPFLGDPEAESVSAVLCANFGLHLRRGLVEALDVFGIQAAILFARDAEEICRRIPLRHLRLFTSVPTPFDEYSRPGTFRTATLRAILDRPFTSRLQTLDLGKVTLTEQGAQALLRYADRLAGLSRLTFNGQGIEDVTRERLKEVFVGRVTVNADPEDDIPF